MMLLQKQERMYRGRDGIEEREVIPLNPHQHVAGLSFHLSEQMQTSTQ